MLSLANSSTEKLHVLNEELTKLNYDKVGLVYPQYPGCKPPSEIYGGTWESIFDNQGLFWRNPGGNALPFNGGVQTDTIRNITAGFSHHGDEGGSLLRSLTGAFRGATKSTYRSSSDPLPGAFSHSSVEFDASRVVPVGPENRPVNATFRLWRCTGI